MIHEVLLVLTVMWLASKVTMCLAITVVVGINRHKRKQEKEQEKKQDINNGKQKKS